MYSSLTLIVGLMLIASRHDIYSIMFKFYICNLSAKNKIVKGNAIRCR